MLNIGEPPAHSSKYNNCNGNHVPNYYAQSVHKDKLPPPFCTRDYSQYEEWLFTLQAFLGLIDRDCNTGCD